jgi:cell division protease FtsH
MNQTSQQQDQTPETQQEHQSFPPRFNWRPMIWFILVWLLIIFLSSPNPDRNRIDLSYSQFKQEVQNGNVVEVTVKGNRITGAFVNAYQVQAEKNGPAYQYFSTLVPSFGDRQLMTLLESNEVVIKAE